MFQKFNLRTFFVNLTRTIQSKQYVKKLSILSSVICNILSTGSKKESPVQEGVTTCQKGVTRCQEGVTRFQEDVNKVLLCIRKLLLSVKKLLLGVRKV